MGQKSSLVGMLADSNIARRSRGRGIDHSTHLLLHDRLGDVFFVCRKLTQTPLTPPPPPPQPQANAIIADLERFFSFGSYTQREYFFDPAAWPNPLPSAFPSTRRRLVLDDAGESLLAGVARRRLGRQTNKCKKDTECAANQCFACVNGECAFKCGEGEQCDKKGACIPIDEPLPLPPLVEEESTAGSVDSTASTNTNTNTNTNKNNNNNHQGNATVVFFGDNITLSTGAEQISSYTPYLSAGVVAAGPLVEPDESSPGKIKHIQPAKDNNPFAFQINKLEAWSINRFPDTISIKGVNTPTLYTPRNVDIIDGKYNKAMGANMKDRDGELARGSFHTQSSVHPLSVLAYDNAGRPGEDVGEGMDWDDNKGKKGSTHAFVTASMRSRPSQALMDRDD